MKHCLIVDDSAVIRKVAKRIMDSLAMRTSEAEDGEQALAACRAEMPDAIFVDWNMPGMDGCDFLKHLRRMEGGDAPKVLFCATENDVPLIARALHAGADDYMMKPFARSDLISKLQDVGVVEPQPSRI